MTPQYKAARDEKAEEQGNRHANPIIRSMYPSRSRGAMAKEFAQLFSLGADWAYAQAQAEVTLLEQELIARKLEIERLAHANRAAEYERDEWRRQAEKLLILAKHARGYPQDVLAAPKVVAEQLLAEYAAWKVEG